MLKNTVAILTKLFHNFRDWQLLLLLFSIAFFIRFPFFFRDYIDRDESTFILMAQSWVEGNLPYTELWDLKPPITFLFFAAIIYTFGKSFVAIRIGGVILVAISSFFTYKIGSQLGHKKVGFYSAFLMVLLQSLFGSLQGVMSEHICMAFFTIGFYIFIAKEKRWHHFVSGIFLGLALMSKLNLGYALVLLFLTTAAFGILKNMYFSTLRKLLIVGIGILTTILLTGLPYYYNGLFELWNASVFKAPLAYSEASDSNPLKVILYALIILFLIGLSLKKQWLELRSEKSWFIIAITLGVLISFLQTGKANGHYLIQLYPSLLLLLGMILTQAGLYLKRNYKYYLLIICFVIPIETYLETGNIIKNRIEEGSFFNGEGIAVPKYFKENGLSVDNVLFLEYHIGYWLMNVKPISKPATHPSNLLRDELFPFMNHPRKTSEEELIYLLEEKKPAYIITRKNRRIFDKKEIAANFYINLQLLKNYQPLDTIQGAVIHKRLPRK